MLRRMKKLTKKEFLKDVMKEVELLKQHTTEDEKSQMDFKSFDPTLRQGCIYGQISGNCESTRAHELMDLCCQRVFELKNTEPGTSNLLNRTFSKVEKDINGSYEGQTWIEKPSIFSERSYRFLSALEGYICLKKSKVKSIFDYIKNKRENLTL